MGEGICGRFAIREVLPYTLCVDYEGGIGVPMRALGQMVVMALLVVGVVFSFRFYEYRADSSGPVAQIYARDCPEELRLFALDYKPVCQTVKIQQEGAPDASLVVLYLRDQRYEDKGPPLLYLRGGYLGDSVPKTADDFLLKMVLLGKVEPSADKGRDIVLVDLRGSGRSRPRVKCPESPDMAAPPVEEDMTDEQRRESSVCVQNFINTYGPIENFVITTRVVDLQQIRQALKIEQWDIFATSYSTRIAAQLVQQDGDSVRSVIYDGVDIFPNGLMQARQLAFDNRLEKADLYCRPPRGCSEKLSDLFLEMINWADEEPFVYIPPNGEEISLNGTSVKSTGYSILYRDEGDKNLHWFLKYLQTRRTGEVFYIGKKESVESFIRQRYGSGKNPDQSIFIMTVIAFCGDYSLGKQPNPKYRIPVIKTSTYEEMSNICKSLNIRSAHYDWSEISKVPALILSGSNDVITPPSHGAYLAEKIGAKCHLVVDGAGHGVAFRNKPEVDAVMAGFWADPYGFEAKNFENCEDISLLP